MSVEAAAPLVDVRSAGISEVVEQEQIVELPLQGRKVTDLIMLAGVGRQHGPGARQSEPCRTAWPSRSRAVCAPAWRITLDGAMHNDPYDNANLPLPFPDALQEFSVATSGLSAQNGMHSAASVNAVTKSGTNNFTATCSSSCATAGSTRRPTLPRSARTARRADDGLQRNQFGGTFGGPIVRDRLFFFGGYQGTSARQTRQRQCAFVPTAAMMAGDFTAVASPACNAGRQVTLRAPFVEQPDRSRAVQPGRGENR